MADKDRNPAEPPVGDASSFASVDAPLIARLSVEVPRPKDWQAFQRNCVLLFREELKDPHAQEYGRSGQDQGGIDILGRRDGNPDHHVGVQCRHIAKPLKEPKILADCRAALELKANLKEIIFATTAPNDTHATDAALSVERTLRAEGHDVTVAIYGWEALQLRIAVHPAVYAAFDPSRVATSLPQVPSTRTADTDHFASQVAAKMVETLRQHGVVALRGDAAGASGSSDEDPALHAKIDVYRDLIREEKEVRVAEQGLLKLSEDPSLGSKPWARFRVETNLASVALELGRPLEAASRYEAALAIRPNDANAIANIALGRTIQGRYAEAMELAQKALDAKPRADRAVSCLLQAAARSSWDGDPQTLIPSDLQGSEHADLGLAEFLRRRDMPGWPERSIELSRRHPKQDAFKQVRAIAVLALALAKGAGVVGGRFPVTIEELNASADDLKALAKRYLDVGYADTADLVANVSNACNLLRLCGRHDESEPLLQQALSRAPADPHLRRLLALTQMALDRPHDALATLSTDSDPENQLFRLELTAAQDPRAALSQLLAMEESGLDARLALMRWSLVGEISLREGNSVTLDLAIGNLRSRGDDFTAELLEIRQAQKGGLEKDAIQERLRAMAARLTPDVEMTKRYFLADEFNDQGLAEEASRILEGHVDLSRPSPATALYLQSLASARRDDAFRKAIAAASPVVRGDPRVLWTIAAHAWNMGDLAAAYSSIEELISLEPKSGRARLLKIEILIRQDRTSELLAELDKPLENLRWPRLRDRFRVASLLGHFGHVERAAAYAYKLFLENRDQAQAWMTLSTLVLREGRTEGDAGRLWNAPVVAHHVAVDLQFEDGEKTFFVVEPDPHLRSQDDDSWEPEHALVRTVTGLAKGAAFVDGDGRKGMVTELRHKYVARLHYVMQHYEARFPEIFGFRSVRLDAKEPDGLDELIAELKVRHDWIKQEQEQYRNGAWPIGVLAHRLHMDTIDVAEGLASQGIPLKVAIGNQAEREAASLAVRANGHKGCVVDLFTFWSAWRLGALNALSATCGPICIPRSVMDILRARQEKIDFSCADGLRSFAYKEGKIAFTEVPATVVKQWRDEIDSAIAWAQGNAKIYPLVAGEDLTPLLREFISTGRSDLFDAVVLAKQENLLLVSDDLVTRQLSQLLVRGESAWLHRVLNVAQEDGVIDLDTFIRWTAQLLDAGHSYLGVSSAALVRALQLDTLDGDAPGELFKALTKSIGGRIAEPRSHLEASIGFLRALWLDEDTAAYRARATGWLLRQLIRERHNDHGLMLRVLLHHLRNFPNLQQYIRSWARGHFIPDAVLEG